MPIIRRRIRLGLHALGRILRQPLLAQPLERRERPRPRLDRIRGRHQIGCRICHVSRRVWILQRLLARVHRPRRDVHLLAGGDVEGFEERVHVLPAVELAETAELGGGYGQEGVAGAIAVDELFDVRGLDLAPVVDHFAGGVDECLGEVERGVVNFGEAEGDVAGEGVSVLWLIFEVVRFGVRTSGCP